MTSEVEERPRLVKGGYGRHRSKCLPDVFDSTQSSLLFAPLTLRKEHFHCSIHDVVDDQTLAPWWSVHFRCSSWQV